MFHFSNGDKYKGAFKNGKREGFGVFTLIDGENTPESGKMIKLVDKVHMSFLMGILMKGCLMMVLWMAKGVFHLTMGTYISESLRKVREWFGSFYL